MIAMKLVFAATFVVALMLNHPMTWPIAAAGVFLDVFSIAVIVWAGRSSR